MSSIGEVARAAGVSPATVSRVLNERHAHLVAPDTRQRVLEAAHLLRYRPSSAATALVDGRTFTVALQASSLRYNSSYSMRFVDVTQRIVDEHGFHLLVVSGSPEFNPADLLRERRVDMVIWTHYPVERADELSEQVAAPHQAVVGCGAIGKRPPETAHCGFWDDRLGYGMAVQHLADFGHDRVALLAGTQIGIKSWPNVLEGFEKAAARRGLHGHVITTDEEIDNLRAGADMAREFLRLRPSPTAIVARNDDFAIGAIHALTEDGIRVPEQVSVVGYNDTPIASYASPALTTIHVPISECLREVVPAVLRQISGEAEHCRVSCTFPIQLSERKSTGPAP